MDNSIESQQTNLILSIKRKHIFIGIIFLMILLPTRLFNSSNQKIPLLYKNLTKHINKPNTTTSSTNSTSLLNSTIVAMTTSSTTSTSTSISTTTQTTTSSATTTAINIDEILCDNMTESQTINISQDPCEKLRCAVILRLSGGRLGNRMFMFASAYGLARTHNCRLHVSSSILNELSNNFQMKSIDKDMWLSNEEVAKLQNIQIKSTVCSFLPELVRPNAFKYIELTGYWQSYLYFDAYREEIREFFSARNDELTELARYSLNITKNICPLCPPLPNATYKEFRHAFQTYYNITWIGIHIRRGDFQGFGYSSDADYIRRAIRFFRRRYHQYHVRFLVASDDKEYCRKLFASEQKTGKIMILPDYFSPADDMIALSLCHHSIITGGTYGFWTAYLAGGEVIHDIKYQAVCSRADYYPSWFMLVGETVEKRA